MGIKELSRIGRKYKATQVSSSQDLRENLSFRNVKYFECAGPLSAFFDLVQKEPAVRRHSQWFHRGILARAPFRGIDQHLVFTVDSIPEADAGLFLAA